MTLESCEAALSPQASVTEQGEMTGDRRVRETLANLPGVLAGHREPRVTVQEHCSRLGVGGGVRGGGQGGRVTPRRRGWPLGGGSWEAAV